MVEVSAKSHGNLQRDAMQKMLVQVTTSITTTRGRRGSVERPGGLAANEKPQTLKHASFAPGRSLDRVLAATWLRIAEQFVPWTLDELMLKSLFWRNADCRFQACGAPTERIQAHYPCRLVSWLSSQLLSSGIPVYLLIPRGLHVGT